MSEEKNKPPTDKKLRDARRDGETVRSTDATSAGVVAAAVGCLWVSAGFLMDRVSRLFDMVWHYPWEGEAAPLGPLLYAMGWELMLLTIPFAFATFAGAAIALIVQGSPTISAKPVMLKLEAINPIAGIKRTFGLRALIESGTTLLKGTVLLALLYFNLRALLPLIVGATARSPELLGALMWQLMIQLLFIAAGVFVVFGLVDYGIQRFIFMRDHRMSDDEIKREYKEMNGNPEIKQARRELAHEMAYGDDPTPIASASMVVANPVHYAVAIAYEPGSIPRVIARGMDEGAVSLRKLAEHHAVPVIVNPPLARTLYRVPLGSSIPRDCFLAVATLLQWVDQIRSRPLPSPSDP